MFFRCYEEPERILTLPDVRRHVERIVGEPRYVETGWPLFAALPLFARLFPERLAVVHLTRHPVHNALSHLAHSSYAGSPRDDSYTRFATLGPEDANVFQTGYAGRWGELSSYEKCLFWCTEVSLFGLEFPERLPQVPFLRVKSEALLGGDKQAMRSLLDFMRLPWREGWPLETRRNVDRWHHHTDREVDPLRIHRHRATVQAAHELGYALDGLDLAALAARYRGRPDTGLDRVGRFA